MSKDQLPDNKYEPRKSPVPLSSEDRTRMAELRKSVTSQLQEMTQIMRRTLLQTERYLSEIKHVFFSGPVNPEEMPFTAEHREGWTEGNAGLRGFGWLRHGFRPVRHRRRSLWLLQRRRGNLFRNCRCTRTD